MGAENPNGKERFQTARVVLVSTSHAVHDTFTGFLPAILPVLIDKFSLSNTLAGMLTVFIRLPSLLQPIIGRAADRKDLKILLILAPTITGAAMSLLGVASTYGFLAFLLIIAGISSASFHAVGPVLGSSLSGKKLGKGMSFWMIGGELGRALGPIIVVTAVAYLTMDGLPWLMLAGVLASCFFYVTLRSETTLSKSKPSQISWKKALGEMKGFLIPIALLIFTRSMVSASLTTYLPTYLTTHGASLWFAGASLTIFEASGIIGSYFAGTLSDRYGRRRMLIISFITTPILLILFILSTNATQIPMLILLGFFFISTSPVILAIIMENAQENRAFANGIFMATSFILSACATLLVGFLSDIVNMRMTFLVSAAVLAFGIPIIFLLPKSQRIHQ